MRVIIWISSEVDSSLGNGKVGGVEVVEVVEVVVSWTPWLERQLYSPRVRGSVRDVIGVIGVIGVMGGYGRRGWRVTQKYPLFYPASPHPHLRIFGGGRARPKFRRAMEECRSVCSEAANQ